MLEQQLQRENVIKLDTRHASNKTIRHTLILSDVHVLHVVELRVGRLLNIKVILFRRIVVHLQHHSRSGILSREFHVVELTKTEVHAGERQLLSLESKIENDFQCTGVGDENRQIFPCEVGAEAEQETFLVGCCEADTNTFSDCRTPRAEEIVFDDGVGTEIYADF